MFGNGARLRRLGFILALILATGSVPARAATSTETAPPNRLVVDEGGIGTRVPPPGWGVLASMLTKDGHQVLQVETGLDGRVLGGHLGRERAPARTAANRTGASAAAASACRDSAWGDLGISERDRHRWYFNPAGRPGNLGARQARRAVAAGRAYFSQQHNDCGYSRMSSANAPTTRYQGTTSRTANITQDGMCGWRDGRNVVRFADINRSSAIAVSCVWYVGDEIRESDTVLDSTGVRWTTNPGPNCRRAMDVASVVVHETGHTFGLAHPAGNHPALSMNSVIMSCSKAFRTLGRGDIRGLRAKYG